MHVNGKLTLSENIADVAGLSASFDAYRTAYGGKPAPDLGGFTGDQRFFIAFAQAWRTKERPQSLRNQLMTDGHAPPEFRGDTVRNIDAWYKPSISNRAASYTSLRTRGCECGET